MLTKVFPLDHVDECPYESIEMRRITGKEEKLAAEKAVAKGETGNFIEEMILLSIVRLVDSDGKPVKKVSLTSMTSELRSLIQLGFDTLNKPSNDTADIFLGKKKKEEPEDGSEETEIDTESPQKH